MKIDVALFRGVVILFSRRLFGIPLESGMASMWPTRTHELVLSLFLQFCIACHWLLNICVLITVTFLHPLFPIPFPFFHIIFLALLVCIFYWPHITGVNYCFTFSWAVFSIVDLWYLYSCHSPKWRVSIFSMERMRGDCTNIGVDKVRLVRSVASDSGYICWFLAVFSWLFPPGVLAPSGPSMILLGRLCWLFLSSLSHGFLSFPHL